MGIIFGSRNETFGFRTYSVRSRSITGLYLDAVLHTQHISFVHTSPETSKCGPKVFAAGLVPRFGKSGLQAICHFTSSNTECTIQLDCISAASILLLVCCLTHDRPPFTH